MRAVREFAMGVIDEVKQRIDIVEVISQYATLKKAGRTLSALCPFHSEKHPSFFVYPEQQSWHCFGACNTGGDVFSFVMKKEGIHFGEALRLLARKAGVTIPSRSEPEAGREEMERLYQMNQAAAQYFNNLLLNSPSGEKARKYIAGRGLSPKAIADFQLGFSLNSWDALKKYLTDRDYAGDELLAAGLVIEAEAGGTHDRFRNKLMFPIQDIRGHIVGFGGRVLDDSLPKYVNSPQTPLFDKSGCLYGINLAALAIRQQGLVVIVEGYLDAITAHQNGFSNVVASMGTAVTEKQVSILKRLTKNIVLALDADAAGEEATLRTVGYENTLAAELRVIILPEGKDPDNVIKEDAKTWQRLLEEAIPVVDYTFKVVTAGLDLNTARGKSQAVDRLLPIVAEIKDAVRQAHYRQVLARLVSVSQHDLEITLGRIKPSRGRRRTKELSQERVTQALRPALSSPVEEYCLALLLQRPELKGRDEGLLAEYFENSENREIFTAWHQAKDVSSLKDRLDPVIWGHLDSLMTRSVPANQIGPRYGNCILRLRERYLKGVAAKRAEVLALAAESGGAAAELAKLEEQGIEVSVQLGEVFTQKSRGSQEQRR
ncbi:DNA primase [Chloroflexota bacterium]